MIRAIYRIDMDPYRLMHFNNVARNMNNYALASTDNYYQSTSDQRNYLFMYEKPLLMNSGLGDVMSYSLQALGIPANIVQFIYNFGSFLDNNA